MKKLLTALAALSLVTVAVAGTTSAPECEGTACIAT